eukprot:COSAG04_NODE_620_length_11861_cov_65.414215_4_plen_124_part_00
MNIIIVFSMKTLLQQIMEIITPFIKAWVRHELRSCAKGLACCKCKRGESLKSVELLESVGKGELSHLSRRHEHTRLSCCRCSRFPSGECLQKAWPKPFPSMPLRSLALAEVCTHPRMTPLPNR